MTPHDELPFALETDLERRVAGDPAWRAGIEFGEPRPGHPEGKVKFHIADVLANVDAFTADSPLRSDLRVIALIHDTFKHEVDPALPRTGENHHGMRARRFAERHVADIRVLDVIETHDEAYNAWQKGHRDGRWTAAQERATRLLIRLGATLDLYLAFYQCDNSTEGKSSEPFEWFRRLTRY